MTESQSGPEGPAASGSGPRRRSLRAVFAADIAGFSGRMSLNETSTVSALSEIRLVGRRVLEKHHGWLFGMPGDGLFATFESAVSAVLCALEMQSDLGSRPHLRETPLRIGIHLGEVIINDDLPYGETLNIAARLESLADPGGILVSGTVMDAVSARVSATFQDRGVPVLKNIPRRIPTFAVQPPPARSPMDQTQLGQSNLDRTTRLDRNALRKILDGQSIGQTPASPDEPVPSAPEPSAEGSTLPAAAAGPLPAPEIEPSVQDQPQEEPRPLTLAEKLAQLPTPPAPVPEPADPAPPAEEPFEPRIAEPQLEKTLPQVAPLPGNPNTAPAAPARPTAAFLDEISKALAVHVGPFSKMIVEREMKANPSTFELISRLEQHIPNQDERLVFRVTASHINSAKSGASQDD